MFKIGLIKTDWNATDISLQDASEQKTELERLKHRIAEEVIKIEERKNKIDDELKEVQVSLKKKLQEKFTF